MSRMVWGCGGPGPRKKVTRQAGKNKQINKHWQWTGSLKFTDTHAHYFFGSGPGNIIIIKVVGELKKCATIFRL